MSRRSQARVVEFPLGGEWMAVHSPGSRVPSHGTDILAQRYAFDLIKVDSRRGIHYHPARTLQLFALGVRTVDCYAWGEPVFAPFDGEVVDASDGLLERMWLHPVRELFHVIANAFSFDPRRQGLRTVLGNHVILGNGDIYALFAHLAPDSVEVEPGQHVTSGEMIGRVGHTGNSTAPHLHFQLMDGPDPLTANGVRCHFREYEALRAGSWTKVEVGVPRTTERIRSHVGDARDTGA